MLKILVVFLFGLAATHAQATWKDCTPAGAPGNIEKVDIVPAQPTKGSTFVITGDGSVTETVSSGKYFIQIKLGGIPLFKHSGDGCAPEHVVLPLGVGTIDFGGLSCPAKPGPVTVVMKTTLSNAAPSGKYVATVQAQDQNGTVILCAEVDFSLSSKEREEQKQVAPLSLVFQKEWLNARVGAANSHYGDPKNGCESDEQAVQVQGLQGDFCSPQCSSSGACPKDIPTGITAKPECALQTTTGGKFCALICSPSLPIKNQMVADAQCGENASCKAVSGVGLCTYND